VSSLQVFQISILSLVKWNHSCVRFLKTNNLLVMILKTIFLSCFWNKFYVFTNKPSCHFFKTKTKFCSSLCWADPLENCHLTVKKSPKTYFFQKNWHKFHYFFSTKLPLASFWHFLTVKWQFSRGSGVEQINKTLLLPVRDCGIEKHSVSKCQPSSGIALEGFDKLVALSVSSHVHFVLL